MTTKRVKSLGFAEIKGTAILPRERIRVGPGGVAGDRRFAAVEAGGGAVLRTVRDPALRPRPSWVRIAKEKRFNGRVQRVCATTAFGGVLCGWMRGVVG